MTSTRTTTTTRSLARHALCHGKAESSPSTRRARRHRVDQVGAGIGRRGQQAGQGMGKPTARRPLHRGAGARVEVDASAAARSSTAIAGPFLAFDRAGYSIRGLSSDLGIRKVVQNVDR